MKKKVISLFIVLFSILAFVIITRNPKVANQIITSTEDIYDTNRINTVALKNGKLTYTQTQLRTGLPIRLCAYLVETVYLDLYGDLMDSNSGQFTVDGISNIKSQTPNDDAIYTLQGVKVEGKPQPGIYVRNGRKVVVK